VIALDQQLPMIAVSCDDSVRAKSVHSDTYDGRPVISAVSYALAMHAANHGRTLRLLMPCIVV
jgi:hypothetical protein